jgi:hypothetical protein
MHTAIAGYLQICSSPKDSTKRYSQYQAKQVLTKIYSFLLYSIGSLV